MKLIQKSLLVLFGTSAVGLATLLTLARTDIKWPYRNGYVKVLPVARWWCHGGNTRFTRQRDGTYQVRRVTYHDVFCYSRMIRGEEAVRLLSEVRDNNPKVQELLSGQS